MSSQVRGKTTGERRKRPLWKCPRCSKFFVTRNMWHSCSVVPWMSHFRGKPKALELFKHFRGALRKLGPVRVVSNQTYLSFMARVRFAGCEVRSDWLRCSLWLKRFASSPRFVKTEKYNNDYIYRFVLRRREDLDEEILGYLREAYLVGQQEAPQPV